ncbi:MAG: transcriptional repressor LexA [Chloroflexota bacterium]
MAKDKLSERQQNILEFIRDFQRESGYPPTIRQIGQRVKISSTSVVNYNLNKLQQAGYLARDLKVSRGLRLSETGEPAAKLPEGVIRIPLVGRIFASEPVPVPGASSSFAPDEAIELTRSLVKDPENLFALQVCGDSMIDAMVSDGDIVVMRRQEQARNGEMVAVWLNDKEETTLKHFYLEGGRVRLQPANPTMNAIYKDPKDVQVQGKVVLVLRQMK